MKNKTVKLLQYSASNFSYLQLQIHDAELSKRVKSKSDWTIETSYAEQLQMTDVRPKETMSTRNGS